MDFNISEELRKLPAKPGVYIMKNNKGQIIYIGKAIVLKNRVRQYFQESNQKADAKVNVMVSQIVEFEYIITDNEIEALVLEATLIKKHKPKYNILLRDDKQYPYIKITMKDMYPKVVKTRELKKDGSKYYGPYPSGTAVNNALELIHSTYKLRTCNLKLDGKKALSRPCLNYYIDKCLGPCQGNIETKLYLSMIDEIKLFLSGRDDILINKLKEDMFKASSQMEFEKAAEYRDKIKSIESIHEEQKVIQTNVKDQDVIGIAKGIEEACIQIFFIRSGKIVGREHFIFYNVENNVNTDILEAFIKQFYSGVAYIPKEIYIEESFSDINVIEDWLSQKANRKINFKIPKKGVKNNLIKMVHLNALEILEKQVNRYKIKQQESFQALENLRLKLQLTENIKRIEAYDISNTQGSYSVGAMVVFENGVKKQSDYRRFRIKTIEGPNDYGSMHEILIRRFKNYLEFNEKFSKLPDLIMMDGGIGQVNIALKILKQLNLNVNVCGLVKDENHKTRGIIYNGKEIKLKSRSLEFQLITRIQDEVHRFAINYHRSLRDQNMVKSELDEIKGIGPKRKKALFKTFKTLSNMKIQPIEALEKVESMNNKSATEVYNYFRK